MSVCSLRLPFLGLSVLVHCLTLVVLFTYSSASCLIIDPEGPDRSPGEHFGDVSGGTGSETGTLKAHGPVISDSLGTIGEELGEVKDLVRKLRERGQAWGTRVAGASFVFPSECVLVP